MNGQRLGVAVRAARIRRRWRQADLANRVGLSQSTVSRIERGHVDTFSVGVVESIAAALEIRIDLVTRWRGGELDRLVNAGHAALHDSIAGWFAKRWPDWKLAPEVSFSVYGERGVIDVLAWHEPTRALLVIELKTALVDLNELVGVMDRKRRLAPGVARSRGWYPVMTGAWVAVASTRTNRRHVASHRAFLANAYPADGRDLRKWLRHPKTPIAALSTETFGAEGRLLVRRRVRARAAARAA